MEFKYLEKNCKHPLIDHFYQLKIFEEDIPFKSLIVPVAQTNITFVFCDKNQKSILLDKNIEYKGLILTGQIYGSYNLEVYAKSENIGFGLKPTALYKILETDISKFNDSHIPLKDVSPKLHDIFFEAFTENRGNEKEFVKAIYKIFEDLPLSKENNIKHIDKAINYIMEKEGLLKVNDLLNVVPFSQKSLEIQFKKIVGVTPKKYIRQYRFIQLMLKYGSQKFKLKDLVDMFDYYDVSHFLRDFKFFLGETPKSFFKKDYPLIKTYLKE